MNSLPMKPPMHGMGINRVGTLGLDQGLIYWPMWVGSGDQVMDVSPYGFKGTFGTGAASPAWINESPVGSALQFDGGDDVNIGKFPIFNLAALSVSLWWRAGGDYTTSQALMGFMRASTGGSWVIGLGVTNNKLEWFRSGGGLLLTSAASFSNDDWHHSVFTRTGYAGGTITHYLDGVFDASDDSGLLGTVDGTEGLRFGQFGEWNGWHFVGGLSNVAIWPGRVLTAADAFYLYAHPWALITPPNHMSLWRSVVGEPAAAYKQRLTLLGVGV